jgi:hypothetical protein
MKRLFLIASMLALVLPALSTAEAPAAVQPSLEALQTAIFEPADPTTAPAGGEYKTTCTVSNDCGPYSATISCMSSAGNCSSGYDYVICDGVRKNCAPCHVFTSCGNGTSFSCTGTTIDNCELEPHCFVICNGVFHGTCPLCP